MFYLDSSMGTAVSWERLTQDIKEMKGAPRFCREFDYYEIFKRIVAAIVASKEVVLFDPEQSDAEVESLKVSYGINDEYYEFETTDLSTPEELIEKLRNPSKGWSIQLFTSGTTGLPKLIKHSFSTLCRSIKRNQEAGVWGMAFHPTHMGGVQVLLQALLTGSTLVRLFGLDKETVHLAIDRYGVTHLSATPTFYRLLLPTNAVHASVRRVSAGGERFDAALFERLRQVFPVAKVTNIYASTEAGAVLAAEGSYFHVKEGLEGWVKISEGELLLHRSLMGSFEHEAEWYRTGDLVDFKEDDPKYFRFVSRDSEVISVGGYKVHAGEVEEELLRIDGVSQAVVYGRVNSVTGQVVCCDLVLSDPELEPQRIRKKLRAKLPEFKVPTVIKVVEEISLTRTGKAKLIHQ